MTAMENRTTSLRRPCLPGRCSALLLTSVLWTAVAAAQPVNAAGVVNGDFEAATVGQVPAGWTLPPAAAEAGYTAAAVEEGAHSGQRAAVLRRDAEGRGFGNLMQSLDAAPFRGKVVRLRAAVRAEPALPWGGAHLWLRVDRAGGRRGFFDNMSERPIRSAEWGEYEIVGDVAEDAETLNLGLMLRGSGRVFVDDVTLEVLGARGAGDRPPAPLSARGVDNLTAFAHLYGYVRFFHPSDEAAAADWQQVALAGVEHVESATDAADLARRLEDVFRPLAPTLRVWPRGVEREGAEAPPAEPRQSAGTWIAWRHDGVELSTRPNIYTSQRVPVAAAGAGGETGGDLSQAVDARGLGLDGARLRLTAAVRYEAAPGDGSSLHTSTETSPETSTETSPETSAKTGAELRLHATVAGDDGEQDRVVASHRIDGGGDGWSTVTLEGELPPGVESFTLALHLDGAGRVWMDDVVVECLAPGAEGEEAGSARAEPLPVLANPDFEAPPAGGGPLGWAVSSDGPSVAHRASVAERAGTPADPSHGGRFCVLLERDAEREPRWRSKPPVYDLGGGVLARLPLLVRRQGGGETTPPSPGQGGSTLPPATGSPPPFHRPIAFYRPAAFLASAADRSVRLADVVVAWNVFQHFYPYFDLVDPDGGVWAALLPRALAAAAEADSRDRHRRVLEEMMATLHDGHGVVDGSDVPDRALPLAWDMIEGRLVITAVGEPAAEGSAAAASAPDLRLGDVVTALDGEPAADALARAEKSVSAATPQWLRRRGLDALAAGFADDTVRLSVLRDGTEHAVSLAHTAPRWGAGAVAEARPEPLAELAPGVAYVDPERLTSEAFEAALAGLAQRRAVIFDLRGYPRVSMFALLSRLTDVPLSSARWRVPTVLRPDREAMGFGFGGWVIQPAAPRFQGRIVFLTDGRAVSAAETLLGIVEHYHLGDVVGGATAGTNGNVNFLPLPSGYRLVWTGMRVTKHDGTPHHGVGIRPTVPAKRTLAGVAAGRDEVLERALELVAAP